MSEPIRIRSYVEGRWVEGEGVQATLLNPATEEVLATAATRAVDMAAALRHAREVGGASLREMGFAARGALLKSLSGVIREHREELLELAMRNGGNTRGDAAFDVDGASGTLAFYAGLAKGMGAGSLLVDGEALTLAKSVPLRGQHVWVPRRGVAVLVNAYNFPAWGFAEKLACAFLAGVPVVVKPATATALVAWRIAELFVASGVLPAGAWSFLAGPPGDLLDHLDGQDVLAFTGSADTGRALRAHPRVLARSVRVNVEADSLNAAVLGPDVDPGSPVWELWAREVAHEVTHKAGQKCTATRRVVVPRERLDAARDALVERLAKVRVGDPMAEGVTMGPVGSAAQRDDVRRGVRELEAGARRVYGDPERPRRDDGGDPGRGFFVGPTLLASDDAGAACAAHRREVFGPVATLMPYGGSAAEAAAVVALGEGSLVASVYSDDASFVRETVRNAAPWSGRITLGSQATAAESWGPGMVLPGLVHGGPGRAGDGEELGGVRGMHLYMQRVALQGAESLLREILG
jgi:oxepin-CoA hydrolase/3-oxo-5,6-dehydrosuberyl-CoA semialdehyde dehydrogenase